MVEHSKQKEQGLKGPVMRKNLASSSDRENSEAKAVPTSRYAVAAGRQTGYGCTRYA